jgi:hypothetical protein
MSILGMLQKKFPFMAAMGDVINLTGNEMPMRSSHLIFLYRSFQCRKSPYCPLYPPDICNIQHNFSSFTWCDPTLDGGGLQPLFSPLQLLDFSMELPRINNTRTEITPYLVKLSIGK